MTLLDITIILAIVIPVLLFGLWLLVSSFNLTGNCKKAKR